LIPRERTLCRGCVGGSAGFTSIEIAVVVAAAALLATVVLLRVLPIIDGAERIAFVQVQKQVRNALLVEAAARIAEGRSSKLGELRGVNPMTLFAAPPANYLGSLPWPTPSRVAPASWYYDEHARALAYKVGRFTSFDGLGGPDDRVEFEVAFVFDDRDGDATFEASRDGFQGLELTPRHAYRWLD
jgi:type II secretory pathway pseudopilin PulG